MLAPSPLMSEFVGMIGSAPVVSHELLDNEGESDGSSISDVASHHHPSRECAMADGPAQPPMVVESAQTATSPDTPRRPSHLRKHTLRNYDNDGRASHHLRRHDHCGTLRPVRMARRGALGVALVRSSMTS